MGRIMGRRLPLNLLPGWSPEGAQRAKSVIGVAKMEPGAFQIQALRLEVLESVNS